MINLPTNLFIAIDITVALIYLIKIINSFKNGFIYEFVSLICLVLSIWLSWFLSPILASRISIIQYAGKEATLLNLLKLDILIDTIIWFGILFIVINIFVALLKPIFKSLTKIPLIGPINKLLGILIGVINATIITLILGLIITTPLFENGKDIKNCTCLSYISNTSDKISQIIYDKAIDEFAGKYEFDADEQRQKLSQWLVEQGIFDE